MNKKIKVFLGAYINSTNAQNLNCLALAKYLDKNKFEIFTLKIYSGNLESQKGKIPGVQIFNCFRPFQFSKYLGFFWGIRKCDIAYLPKGELWKYNHLLIKLLRKKSFSTIEGILDDENMASAIEHQGSKENVLLSHKSTDKLFAITRFLGEYNFKTHGIKSEPQILYLGSDTETFQNQVQRTGQLKTIISIGRLKKRKGIYDLLELAKHFPEIQFLIYGSGEEEANVRHLISENKLTNIELKGVVTHVQLAEILKKVDLHILPSRSEGFPKVTLETAAAGVPSLVYSDYGAAEWITHSKDGFVVNTLDEMKNTISVIIKQPEKLIEVSAYAIKLAKRFDWKILVKNWEKEIISICN